MSQAALLEGHRRRCPSACWPAGLCHLEHCRWSRHVRSIVFAQGKGEASSMYASSPRTWFRRPRRFFGTLLPTLSRLALLLGLAVPTAEAASAESRVIPQLQKDAAKYPNKKFRVIITRKKNREVVGNRHVRGAAG